MSLAKAAIVVVLATLAGLYLLHGSSPIPPHLLNHKLLFIPDLVPEDVRL
jgi:hypothetical protein